MTSRFSSVLFSTTLFSAAALLAVGCSKQIETITVPASTAPTPIQPSATVSMPVSTPPSSTTLGTAIDDTVVTASVKSALLADADIKSIDFKVETRKGEVMLSGFVDNQSQKDRASTLVKAVNGVKSVQNNVTLKDGTTTVGNKVDDTITTAKVKAALVADEAIKSMDIGVVTRKGEVQLSGFVNSKSQIDRAVMIAAKVDGVSKVNNEMSIKQ